MGPVPELRFLFADVLSFLQCSDTGDTSKSPEGAGLAAPFSKWMGKSFLGSRRSLAPSPISKPQPLILGGSMGTPGRVPLYVAVFIPYCATPQASQEPPVCPFQLLPEPSVCGVLSSLRWGFQN